MQKKYFSFQPKGMNTNMSFKFQSNEYATYMKNIRLTEDDNGIMSLQFERGNKKIDLDINGTPIGVCILNKYLIIFTHADYIANGEVSSTTDYIYRIEINDDKLTSTSLFKGNLNFDINHPLETLGVYENEEIQKVYFIDGKNQARVINIVQTYTDRYKLYADKNIPIDTLDKSLDFVAELQLNEHVTVNKIIGNGSFPQGTIQYVFSYYNKYGRQSNLFYQSALQYLSYQNGVSPEDKVNCSFKIKVFNVDKQFDYLRVYSIIRTTQDAIPTCKRVIDLKIDSDNLEFIDNGQIGDNIDNTELLYLGGNTICPNTFEQKDGTLFLGNYTIENNDLTKEQITKIAELLHDKIEFTTNSDRIDLSSDNNYYNYKGQLLNANIAGYKFMEWYGVAIQFQNKTGRFSSPVYLGSIRNYAPTKLISATIERGELKLSVNLSDINTAIPNFSDVWVKARLLIVNPTNNLMTILGQGIISSTIFNYRDRNSNSPFAMSSWKMTPLGNHLNPLHNNQTSKGEVQNISIAKSPVVSNSSETLNITISYSMFIGNYNAVIKDDSGKVLYRVLNGTIVGAKEAIKNFNSAIDVSKIPDDKDSWSKGGSVSQTINTNDANTIATDFGECFAYDESIVTFNSPDLENQYNNINTNNKLRIIGMLKATPLFSNYLIQATDLNDPTKGNLPDISMTNFNSNLLWRDMDSSWDNLKDYDTNKDWFFATYLWHRETSLSDNGIEKKGSGDNVQKVWSKLSKKIISNTRTCDTLYLQDNMSYKDAFVDSENKFNYYELPIDDINVIATNNDALYKINNNYGGDDSLSYMADVNKLFPTMNDYYVYGRKYYAYYNSIFTDKVTYDNVIVNDKAVTSKDPIRIKYKETPHAVIVFGSKNGKTIKLPRLSLNHKSDIDKNTNVKAFWTDTLYTNNYIWEDYISKYSSYMSTGDKSDFKYYNAYPNRYNYYYIADLCVNNPDKSPYEDYNGNNDIISQYSFISAGEVEVLSNDTILYGQYGDTYYQRWDCLKTFPYSTDDKNQYIDITSFFIESRINLDGRYDKQRGLKYNLGVLNTNFNLINSSYTQKNNFFNYRQIENDDIKVFTNQITTTNTKVLGSDIDAWTNITLASTFDLDGDKGKLNAIRKINNDLYCFQDSGISRLLYNSRVQINTSDSMPIEIANSAKLQDKQYLSDTIGCQNKWTIKSTPQGIYFIDNYSGSLYRLGSKGIESISDSKMKNYFSSLPTGVWSPSNITTKVEYDNITKDLYIITKDKSLAYNEFLGEFTSFYDYNPLYMVNLEDKSLQLNTSKTVEAVTYNKTNLWESYKGNYGSFYGSNNAEASISFIANGDFNIDKVFETLELSTNDMAKVSYINSDYYPFDKLNISNEYQEGNSIASNSTLRKKFRTWRWQLPRDKTHKFDRIRNEWAKIEISKTYNSPLSIYDMNVAYYI